ncbi:TIGR00730 family Rossman fold protein [Brachybacterium sp. MASK1Z-5]|uniref:Cytokinin riboside 5'-monophosphate phosphoribohydrolase n=1 Tax=Brachybacterium halotolerans TaxID=2795215 RepID=A0ABS1B9J5_9MICO|nr:TIGR00730 family Rossman fold protein [Brachybacterium halotolerans]MBK0331329.1 TIGR00730 family Rossman fold protein [Brachybacterium halotolerans]
MIAARDHQDASQPSSSDSPLELRRITVFTGSASGDSPIFAERTAQLARALADHGIGIVYGGGKVGLMGVLADAALDAGGEVHGVMPRALVDGEIAHAGLTALDVVADMHERKQRMGELADAFVALPGGAGTLEELFEVWTWQQLGIHGKPVAILDVDGYWLPLLAALGGMSAHGFLSPQFLASLVVAETPDDLLAKMSAWAPPPAKWS